MGEKLKAAVDAIPDVMAELTREFVEKKELTSRVQVRMRMKALLDFLSADTEYPPNPLVDGKKAPMQDNFVQAQPSVFTGSQGGLGFGTGTTLNMANPVAIPMAVPIPSALPIDNADILG